MRKIKDITEESANPNTLWVQIMDYLYTQSRIMMKEYIRRKRDNKPFTWNDINAMNKKIHNDVDAITDEVENVEENKR